MILSFSQYFSNQLDEKLITFGGQAYPPFGQVIIMAGGAGCFDQDTLVKTENGYKKISEIEKGELVYTIDEDTKQISLKPVIDIFDFDDHSENILELTFENGEKVICTENHEFYIDGEWIKAKELATL